MSGPPESAEGLFARLDGWSAVVAEGPDAVKFLQAFCTNDVQKLADGEACEAMFTDVKAHVIAYGWVARFDARCVVLLGSDRAPALAEHLERYILRDDVRLSLAAWRYAWSDSPLEAAVAVPVSAFGAGAVVYADEEGLPVPEGVRELSAEEFEARRIRFGVPRDGVDVDERNLPQEVDRNDHAISFTKGCYLGQEPVARIDALGRVNWLLRGLLFEETEGLARDAELTAGEKTVGRVTSFVEVERGAIGLGYVRREHAAPGTRLSLGGASVVTSALPISVSEQPTNGANTGE